MLKDHGANNLAGYDIHDATLQQLYLLANFYLTDHHLKLRYTHSSVRQLNVKQQPFKML